MSPKGLSGLSLDSSASNAPNASTHNQPLGGFVQVCDSVIEHLTEEIGSTSLERAQFVARRYEPALDNLPEQVLVGPSQGPRAPQRFTRAIVSLSSTELGG